MSFYTSPRDWYRACSIFTDLDTRLRWYRIDYYVIWRKMDFRLKHGWPFRRLEGKSIVCVVIADKCWLMGKESPLLQVLVQCGQLQSSSMYTLLRAAFTTFIIILHLWLLLRSEIKLPSHGWEITNIFICFLPYLHLSFRNFTFLYKQYYIKTKLVLLIFH